MLVMKLEHVAVIFELKPLSKGLGNGDAASVPAATIPVLVVEAFDDDEATLVTVTVGVAFSVVLAVEDMTENVVS